MAKTAIPVTRVEVIDAIGAASGRGPLNKSDNLNAVHSAGARDPVVTLLDGLPERLYRHPADMWEEMPDVPIEP